VDKRFTLFAILVAAIFVANQIIYSLIFPPPPRQAVAKKDQAAKVEQAQDAKGKPADKPNGKLADKPPVPQADQNDGPPVQPAAEAPAVAADDAPKDADAATEQPPAVPPQWVTLGSANPADPYRMLVTLTNRGAAVERLELSSPRYRDLEDRSGYLGHLSPNDAPNRGGARVRVVGAGTPAALAGLRVDDVITAVGDERVASAIELVEALKATDPYHEIKISVQRDGAAKELTAKLGRRPLEVMRPEFESKHVEVVQAKNHDPFSFLMTLHQFDEKKLKDDNAEIEGVDLVSSEWEVASATQEAVSFRKRLPKLGLEVLKTYQLQKVPPDQLADPDYPAYHLWLEVKIVNVGQQPHRVAYRLDGPTGLPIEGAWYASKVSFGWSGAGLRDIMTQFEGGKPTQVTQSELVDPDKHLGWPDSALDYIAVDAQYFAAAAIPQKSKPTDVLFANVKPTRVGAIPPEKADLKLLNISFSLESIAAELAPGAEPLAHRYQIFAGPKRPGLLAHYEAPGTTVTLGELVYYGWFGIVARPMLVILHAFHYVVGNYGLAIIMLTVLVRGCMFPLSRKQALGMQKMQELQPEMKRINEKYKNEPEKKTRATQDLFRQHNYNPVGGCMLALVQTPILIGLYRSLMVDVELRQAPLFGEGIRWASNLAAPDMLWDWSGVMPEFIAHGSGFFMLGPYLNIFPLLTIGLFIWQQKKFMPPPADEQAAMQQKMMQYMMIFMGFMFYRVASGLCVYFIASSLWGIAERKFLPKAAPKSGPSATGSSAAAPSSSSAGNGAPSGKKRQRGRK
jgi:YidC/Oxa1 family membrane protein insertase